MQGFWTDCRHLAFTATPALLAAIAIGAALSGCSPVGLAVGAGATVANAALRDDGLTGAATDTRIQADINQKWLAHDIEMARQLELTVRESRVLIAGSVAKPEYRVDAVRLAWEVPGVKEVINEARIGRGGDAIDYARDAIIAQRLRNSMMFDQQIYAVNYSVDSVDGVVYLMGVARSQAELERVQNYARQIAYVRRIVSHVRIKHQ